MAICLAGGTYKLLPFERQDPNLLKVGKLRATDGSCGYPFSGWINLEGRIIPFTFMQDRLEEGYLRVKITRRDRTVYEIQLLTLNLDGNYIPISSLGKVEKEHNELIDILTLQYRHLMQSIQLALRLPMTHVYNHFIDRISKTKEELGF